MQLTKANLAASQKPCKHWVWGQSANKYFDLCNSFYGAEAHWERVCSSKIYCTGRNRRESETRHFSGFSVRNIFTFQCWRAV